MKTITITAYQRPHLLSAMLKTLTANDLSGWCILIAIEPSRFAEENVGLVKENLQGLDYEITVNSQRLGITENPFRLLERAFAIGSELNLYLEEDLLLSPDTTKLADWYLKNHRMEWLCLSLIAGGCASAGFISNVDFPDLLFPGYTFNSLGFAVRRAEWNGYMRSAWMSEPSGIAQYNGGPTYGWDWSIFSILLQNHHLRTLQPVLARSTHNGRLNGEFCTPDFHDAAFAGLPIHAGSAKALSYRVVPPDLLPTVVRRHARLWFEMTCALRALAH